MKTTRIPRSSLRNTTRDSKRELLDGWFSMSTKERRQWYAGTARAAEIAGVSRRTLLDWIHAGKVASLRIGKKHHVYLMSLKTHLNHRNGLALGKR